MDAEEIARLFCGGSIDHHLRRVLAGEVTPNRAALRAWFPETSDEVISEGVELALRRLEAECLLQHRPFRTH